MVMTTLIAFSLMKQTRIVLLYGIYSLNNLYLVFLGFNLKILMLFLKKNEEHADEGEQPD